MNRTFPRKLLLTGAIVGAVMSVLAIGPASATHWSASGSYAIQGCDGYAPTIVGTSGNDVIHGTEEADVILALAGNDTIYGHGGNDRICGEAGDDHLYGEDGHDRLFPQSGLDRVWGGYGNDRLEAADGVVGETVNGQSGTDACFYDAGDNVYYCEDPAG